MLKREEVEARDPQAFGHPMNMEVVHRNLLDIKEIFNSYHIQFWLWFGTFLGLYRDGALIPWDEDTDFAIYWPSMYKLRELAPIFEAKGFMVCESVLARDHEHTDFSIFFPHPDDEDKLVAGPLEVDKEDFGIPNSIQFLGQEWRILNNPEKWLKYLYGDNWRIPDKNFGPCGVPHGAEGPIIDRVMMARLDEHSVECFTCAERITEILENGELKITKVESYGKP